MGQDGQIIWVLVAGLIGVNLIGLCVVLVDRLRRRMGARPVAGGVLLLWAMAGGWAGVRAGLSLCGGRDRVFGRWLALSILPAGILWLVLVGGCLPDTALGRQVAGLRAPLLAVFVPDAGELTLARLRAMLHVAPHLDKPGVDLHPYDN